MIFTLAERVVENVVESARQVTRERFVGGAYLTRVDADAALKSLKLESGDTADVVPQLRNHTWVYRVLVKRYRLVKKHTEKVIFTPYIDGIGRLA